jgi:hypothetical protein
MSNTTLSLKASTNRGTQELVEAHNTGATLRRELHQLKTKKRLIQARIDTLECGISAIDQFLVSRGAKRG